MTNAIRKATNAPYSACSQYSWASAITLSKLLFCNTSTTELAQLERHGLEQSEINFREVVFFSTTQNIYKIIA